MLKILAILFMLALVGGMIYLYRKFESRILTLYKRASEKTYHSAGTDRWDERLLGWLVKGGGAKEFWFHGELLGFLFLIALNIFIPAKALADKNRGMFILLIIMRLIPILYLLLLVWHMNNLVRKHPLLSLRRQILAAAREQKKPPVPIYRLFTNIPGRWSTFGQPGFASMEFAIFPVYVLLNEVEYGALEKKNEAWLANHLSRVIILIDPEKGDSPQPEDMLHRVQSYAGKPHISMLGLFLAQPRKNEKWYCLWELLQKEGETKEITLHQLRDQPALGSILALLPRPVLDTFSIARQMGPDFTKLHSLLSQAPLPIARMYKKMCQVPSFTHSIFIFFDCIDAIAKLCLFSLAGAHGDAPQCAKTWSRKYTGLRKMVSMIKEYAEKKNLPEGWIQHFKTIKTALPLHPIRDDIPLLEDFLNLKIETDDEIGFEGLAALITVLRNKTRGHGIITAQLGKRLAPPLFRLLLIFISITRITRLSLSYRYGEFLIKSIGGEPTTLSPLLTGPGEDTILFFQEAAGDQIIYLDYSTGEKSRITAPPG